MNADIILIFLFLISMFVIKNKDTACSRKREWCTIYRAIELSNNVTDYRTYDVQSYNRAPSCEIRQTAVYSRKYENG